MRRPVIILAAAIALAGCGSSDITGGTSGLTPPANLTYQLVPSGDPTTPESIMLRWDPVDDSRVTNYVVYSRGSSGEQWSRRAETTSASFNDLGVPDFQYQVASESADGSESAPSNTITVDASNTLITPGTLSSISLNQAVWLSWPADSRLDAPDLFDYYRVYSTFYDLDQNLCDTNWVLEGTTVSEDFLVTNLPNGQTRCFAVSAISVDGHESTWSNARLDTPRSDPKTVLVYVAETKPDSAAFIFNDETPRLLGVIGAVSRADADFRMNRDPDGTVWITPARVGSTMRLFQDASVADLTEIDRAPLTGYSSAGIAILPGDGYVFQLQETDGIHFGAVHVQYATPQYVIFDWAYQDGVGNPELSRRKR